MKLRQRYFEDDPIDVQLELIDDVPVCVPPSVAMKMEAQIKRYQELMRVSRKHEYIPELHDPFTGN